MSLRPVSTCRKTEADQSSTAPTHTLSGRDDETESLTPAETSDITTPLVNYSKRPTDRFKFYPNISFVWILLVYYRIYHEDGAIPSKAPAAPGDPFLGRIKARSVPPPRRDTVKAVKLSIAKVEKIEIKDRPNTSLFLTPYSQSPMGDADKVTALNRTTGPGSTPQDPLAFVAKVSVPVSAFQFRGRGGLKSAGVPDTTPDSEIRYRTSIQHSPIFLFVLTSQLLWEVYYLLYDDNYEVPSKIAFDPEEPSLGRIRIDSVPPPHSAVTIKRCISRVERTPAIAYAQLFADLSCNTPLKEDHISFLRTDCPGLSRMNPMAIVQNLSIPDGRYVVKNRTADIYWNAGYNPIKNVVRIRRSSIEGAKECNFAQVNEHRLQLFKVQRIILFWSGTSHMMLMVTSSWHHRMLHPRGLVLRWLGLRFQFRGDWYQRIAHFSSQSDHNTFCGIICHTFFFSSLTSDLDPFSRNPRVSAAQPNLPEMDRSSLGVRIFCFWLTVMSIPVFR